MIRDGQFYFLLFFSMSVLGWMIEVACKYVEFRRFINRGFLIGPYCPIYGFGSVLIVWMLADHVDEPFVVFVLAMLICGILEYLTSYLMEKLFHARWWDYSHKRFHINGRVCAETLIPFGALGLLLIYGIKPLLFRAFSCFSPMMLNILCISLGTLLLADAVVSTNVLGKIRSTATLTGADDTETLTKAVRERLFQHNVLVRRTFRAFPYVRLYNRKLIEQLRDTQKELSIQSKLKKKQLQDEFEELKKQLKERKNGMEREK